MRVLSQRSTLLHLPSHQPYTFQSQASLSFSKMISRKTPLTAVIAIIRAYPSFNVSNTRFLIVSLSRRMTLLPAERYLSIFRRRRRIFFAIISRRRFQVNANLQVTRVSWPLCAYTRVYAPASSLCVCRLKRKPHSSRLGKRKTMMKSWWRGCLNASNWIASFIRRDNADGSGGSSSGTRRTFVPLFPGKEATTCRCIVDASSKSSAVPFNHASMMNARANIIFDRGNDFNNPPRFRCSLNPCMRVYVCVCLRRNCRVGSWSIERNQSSRFLRDYAKYELGISSFYSKVCASRCWKLIQ